MSTNLQRIGSVLINMDDVAQELNIKGVRRYDEEEENEYFSPLIARDELENAGVEDELHPEYMKIKKIAGEPITQLATSIEGDRKTIENALKLGGLPADQYYLASSGKAAEKDTASIKNDYNAEIAELKDELIQLRQELAKKGIVDTIRPYAGFYDTFRANYPLHQAGAIATCYRDSAVQNQMRIRDDEIDQFSKGDYVIVTTDNDTSDNGFAFVQIQDIIGTTLIFDAYTGFPIKAEKTHVYRSYGVAYQNTFAFGKFNAMHASNKEIYTCLDDDNYKTRKKINAPRTGWATTFRITPMKADGSSQYYISAIEIVAKKYGNPGALMCYVINANDVGNWLNAQQAEEDGLILATSQPLAVESRASEAVCQFDFGEDGAYPLLKDIDVGDTDQAKTRFCMIIEALEADTSNYYEILCLQHYDSVTNSVGDLQLNNILYQYSSVDIRTTGVSALRTSDAINNSDLYYGVTLKPVVEGSYSCYPRGLYSAEFKTYEPVRANKARVTLRVAREGVFNVSRTSADATNNVKDNGTITVSEDRSYRSNEDAGSNVNPFAVFTTHPYIVGTNIVNITEVSGMTLRLSKGAHIEAGDPVYPMGYRLSVRAVNRVWDPLTQVMRQDGASVKFSMELTQVQPAYFSNEVSARDLMLAANNEETSDVLRARLKEKVVVSDRLIFEADVRNADGYDENGEKLSGEALTEAINRKYNTFYIQIYWEMSSDQKCDSFAGRIYDLAVSLDRKQFATV